MTATLFAACGSGMVFLVLLSSLCLCGAHGLHVVPDLAVGGVFVGEEVEVGGLQDLGVVELTAEVGVHGVVSYVFVPPGGAFGEGFVGGGTLDVLRRPARGGMGSAVLASVVEEGEVVGGVVFVVVWTMEILMGVAEELPVDVGVDGLDGLQEGVDASNGLLHVPFGGCARGAGGVDDLAVFHND